MGVRIWFWSSIFFGEMSHPFSRSNIELSKRTPCTDSLTCSVCLLYKYFSTWNKDEGAGLAILRSNSSMCWHIRFFDISYLVSSHLLDMIECSGKEKDCQMCEGYSPSLMAWVIWFSWHMVTGLLDNTYKVCENHGRGWWCNVKTASVKGCHFKIWKMLLVWICAWSSKMITAW